MEWKRLPSGLVSELRVWPVVLWAVVLWAVLLCCGVTRAADTLIEYQSPKDLPNTAVELWQGYDAEAEPLEIEVVREWNEQGVTSRYVIFTVGTFKGQVARLAAYYCFPNSPGRHPAFVWSHGGGQRAERPRGVYFAKQGYATVDINWLGRPLEEGIEVNTDWGRVDPTQGPNFYPKALRKGWKMNLKPDEYSIDPIVSPRNSNWFLLALAGRRAITFLTEQPEVDVERIGFAGYSMGGMVTALTSIDERLKAVVPFVGGSGFKHVDLLGVEGSSLKHQVGDDVGLYSRTIDTSSYWPHVKIPVMFITSSNDFHSTFERIEQSMALLPHDEWRVTSNQHQNHGPGPEQWVALNLWFDQYLKGSGKPIAKKPQTEISKQDGGYLFRIRPDRPEELVSVKVFYSHDPNSRTRFWESAKVSASGGVYSSSLPAHVGLPTYAFAHCRYSLTDAIELERGQTSVVGINSVEQVMMPGQFDMKRFESLASSSMILDGKADWRKDWSSRDGRTLKTYKFQSPYIRKTQDGRLRVVVDCKDKSLALRLNVSGKFLDRRASQGDYVFTRAIRGEGEQEILIAREDFKSEGDTQLDWNKIATFEMTLVDLKSRQPITLSSAGGQGYMKVIEFVE